MSIKIVQLNACADDSDMGLAKGEPFYVATSADAVIGLDKFITKQLIAKQVVTYQPTTETVDGSMAATDKNKTEPFEGIKFKSPDGSIFVLSVDNNGKPVFTKEESNVR